MQNPIAVGNLGWILHCNCEGTEQLQKRENQCGSVTMEVMTVNGKEYEIRKLLGHGKGGYSYLAVRGEKEYVLKQIHHEPCDYYQFGNKMEAEKRDYDRLKKTGIRMP